MLVKLLGKGLALVLAAAVTLCAIVRVCLRRYDY
jgi:hypothetical protein